MRFEKKVWLASPTMHGDELKYMQEAYSTNWMSTVGKNIDEVERLVTEKVGCKYAVALGAGTAALHLCTRLAGEALYGRAPAGKGSLSGHKVFCSDMTFAATLNPVAYENGEAVFIDSERDTWNMDPVALERAFEKYPDVRLVVLVHLYGTPAKVDEIRAICDRHKALLIEDAAESLGATYKGKQTGTFGDYSAISFNGNKIITGSSGGMFLTDSEKDAAQVRKWSTQSREPRPWYEHEEIGYNYRMSNVCAGIGRGQMTVLDKHIAHHKHVQALYEELLKDVDGVDIHKQPADALYDANFWLCTATIDENIKIKGQENVYKEVIKTAVGGAAGVIKAVDSATTDCQPNDNVEALRVYMLAKKIECRPVWKPMHKQPVYENAVSYVTGV